MKFCKDCKWYRAVRVECSSPETPKLRDPVTGVSQAAQTNPYILREYSIWCSPEAKWFEAKQSA